MGKTVRHPSWKVPMQSIPGPLMLQESLNLDKESKQQQDTAIVITIPSRAASDLQLESQPSSSKVVMEAPMSRDEEEVSIGTGLPNRRNGFRRADDEREIGCLRPERIA